MDRVVATHQKTQQGLKLNILRIRSKTRPLVATHQKTQQGLKLCSVDNVISLMPRRNASENPAGIETKEGRRGLAHDFKVATHQKTQQGLKL